MFFKWSYMQLYNQKKTKKYIKHIYRLNFASYVDLQRQTLQEIKKAKVKFNDQV